MSDALTMALRQAWLDAAAAAPGTRAWRAVRLAWPGPLSLLAAIRETDGASALLFETPIENAPADRTRFEADGISMFEERNFPSRVYRIAVTLERHDLGGIFGLVVADLIETLVPVLPGRHAISALISRLTTWQDFLRARQNGLSREAVAGLFGELVVLQTLSGIVGWASATDAWKGPTGGLHDFVRHGIALEVKTAAGSANVIEISSLDQLDDTALTALLLIHVRLAEGTGGLTLSAMVASIRDQLCGSEPAAARKFRDALLASGYADSDAELYQSNAYRAVKIDSFKVSAGFPRLIRAGVAQGVVDARYRLDMRALQAYAVDEATAKAVAGQMGSKHE